MIRILSPSNVLCDPQTSQDQDTAWNDRLWVIRYQIRKLSTRRASIEQRIAEISRQVAELSEAETPGEREVAP